ncbi:CapA family protein [Butyricimonas sp.]|uniref:CapA family protein n=1 Tax=Butyricimonas sp. TaxID=1969738 RepID=UPI0025B9E3A3|nr:CapA family protein [Butyricimonas sp.]
MIKISFVGDIMCEKPLQNYYLKYDKDAFNKLFGKTKGLFLESDYVVGNLETVFAGEQAGYTDHIYCFNTPDAFAESLAKSGIGMVTTATNHSLDRGVNGLLRTLDILDDNEIEHTGTFRGLTNNVYIKEIKGMKIGFVSYTYGTNTHETNIILTEEQKCLLNLLQPQSYKLQQLEKNSSSNNGLLRALSRGALGWLSIESKMKINRLLHRPYNVPRIDTLSKEEEENVFYKKLEADISYAKKESDLLFVCTHMGGQFNAKPGDFSRYIARSIATMGADFVISNHAHVVHSFEQIDNTGVFYCLGNYSISPSSIYVLHDLKPEYSICLHVYIDVKSKVTKCTFSILKIVETRNRQLIVWPIDELDERLDVKERVLLQKDATFIYNRFLGENQKSIELKREYPILINLDRSTILH